MKKGFTLIELLVVIGILAILLAITLIAINPARQFGQANNTRRRSDSLQVLNAIHQYAAEHQGNLPAGIPTGVLGTDDIQIGNRASDLDICTLLMPDYIPALPVEPTTSKDLNNVTSITNCGTPTPAEYHLGYSIVQDAGHRVTVSAVNTDNKAVINVTR